jgi:uncharacterized protein (TIGR00369 family)
MREVLNERIGWIVRFKRTTRWLTDEDRNSMPTKSGAPGGVAAKEMHRRLRENGTTQHMGFVLIKASYGRVVLKMRVAKKHLQVHGVVHGGVLAAMADTAGGLASYMAAPPGQRVATIEMKINYLEAVASGTVTADAKVVRIGRHISVVDCNITDDTKRLIGKALMTFFVGPFPPPAISADRKEKAKNEK